MGLACLATGLAGLGLGARDGARAAASCTAALRSGDGVVVEGESATAVRPSSRAGGAPAARWSRLELFDVRLWRGKELCRLPRLLVRLSRPEKQVPAGRRLRMVGEWRRFGSGDRRAPQAPDRYGAAYGTLAESVPEAQPRTPVAGRKGASPSSSLRALRAGAAARLERRIPADALPAAKALVIAERSELAPAVTRRFADAGMIHLLAISGLHVGLLAGGVVWLGGLVMDRRVRWPAAALLMALYVAAIGAPPAAVRAALLFGGMAVARVRGAPARPGDLLGWAAALSLLASPLLLTDPGYQLSFAGWTGLFAGDRAALRLFGPRAGAAGGGGAGALPSAGAGSGGSVGAYVRRRLRGPLRALCASLGAFACTAPIAAAHFGRVAPASVVSSLVGAPLVALALVGLIGGLLVPGVPGELFAAGAAGPIRVLLELAERFAGLPLHGPAAPPDAPGWAALVLAGAGAWLLLGGRGAPEPGRAPVGRRSPVSRARSRDRARATLCLAGAVALWTAAPGLRAVGPGGTALLCTLDVGQGDAAVLRTRRGHWIVFDAGPGPGFEASDARAREARRGARGGRGSSSGRWDAGSRVLVPFLRARGARKVELFVLSHPHLDHLGGAGALFDAFRVRRVLDAGAPVPSAPYLGYLDAIEEEGARWLSAGPGARLRLDEVELLVLGPPTHGGVHGGDGPAGSGREGATGAALDPNDASLAVRVRIGDRFVYLNTGDAPVEAEAAILERWPADSLRADLLKLGHHGSRTSSAVAWLEAVRPEAAVLSVGGGNRYGHPHPSTLARLDSAAVTRLWRTDRDGTLCVSVEADGRWRRVDP